MSQRDASPIAERLPEIQKELNRLYRRRSALLNLIRSVEEYLIVADSKDTLLCSPPPIRKPNFRVVYNRAIKEMIG